MVDIHCHILPALDDGAKDLETSLEMCRMAADDGIEAIVCTMHANARFPFDPDLVERKVREVATQSGGVPHLYPGCDFHLSYENLQSALAAPRRFTINHGHYLLVELADFAIPPHMVQTFFELRSRGMTPIVTHPERNPWLLSAGRQLFDWVQAGALVQVTAGSLLGRFGKSPARFCRWLLESRMIHFVASDAHNTTHRPPLLRDAYNEVAGKFGHDLAELIFKQYPRAALESEPIFPEPPALPSRKTFLTEWWTDSAASTIPQESCRPVIPRFAAPKSSQGQRCRLDAATTLACLVYDIRIWFGPGGREEKR